MKTTAMILSAGQGKRMGTDTPKQYLNLAGRPLLAYTLEAFEKSLVDEIVIVAGEEDLAFVQSEIVKKYEFRKVANIIAGGKQRYDSVYCGLKAIVDCTNVLIHDGARPFISPDVINRIISMLQNEEAVVAGMPVKDTIKLADEAGYIASTTERKLTWAAQTPQAFRYELILDAYTSLLAQESKPSGAERPLLETVTDDAMVFSLRYPEKKVLLTEGGYENSKITTPEDLLLAQYLLKDSKT